MASGPMSGSVKMEPGNSRMQQRRQAGPNGPTLPTFIYEYLLKRKQWDVVRSLLKSDIAAEISHSRQTKSSSEINGVDEESDMSNKGEFPIPVNPNGEPLSEQNPPFLDDWWSLFWSIWNHSRNTNGATDNAVGQFMAHQAMQKRAGDPAAMLGPQNLMAANGMMMARMGNPGIPNNPSMDMQRRAALVANAQRGPNGMMRPNPMGGQQPMGPAQMQRDGSQVDANGQDRAGSPMSGGGDNQPSPKRPRIEGGFNGQAMNSGARNPNMPQMNGAPNGTPTMMTTGFDPANGMNQFTALQGQSPMFSGIKGQRVSMGDGGMPKNFMPQNGMPPAVMPNGDFRGEFVQNPTAPIRNPTGQAGPQNGGALADYQMQLMLLEQQNKKRLLMARQENDVMTQANGQMITPGAMPGPGAPFPQQGQNGAFQTTPNGQMQQQQMDMARAQGAQARPGAGFGPGGMPPNMMQPQPGVDQRNNMPPPQAPGVANAQGRPPGSPAQPPNPPTPSQAKQPNPKSQSKKNAKDNEGKGKKNQKKTTGATPSAESENNPPTPTPAPPITPQHPQSFNKPGATGQGGPQSTSGPNNGSGPVQGGPDMPPTDQPGQQPFGNLGGDMDQQGHDQFNFGGLADFPVDMGMPNGDNVLEGFDFGSFLNMEEDGGMSFDPNFALSNDGVEMGTGQQ